MPFTSNQDSSIGDFDPNLDETTDMWMEIVNDMSDIDLKTNEDVCSLSFLQHANVTAEDRRNDLAVRAIVPSDDYYTFDWNGDMETFTGQRETFDITSGPTFPVSDQTAVVEVFYKMLDTDFIDLLCTQTNLFATQKMEHFKNNNKLLPHSRLNRWTPVDRDEMISFLSICILQGLYHLQGEESYFSFNGYGTMPYFSRIMSYNRFRLLKSFLSFSENDTVTEPTKLSEIQPVIDYFNKTFSTLYYPSQDIVIDEYLLKWHGKFSQKPLLKAAEKSYELCESSSGYLWKFVVHAGKDKPLKTQKKKNVMFGERSVEDNNDDVTDDNNDKMTERQMTRHDIQPTNATARIIYDLVTPLLHHGHTVTMDNFYNSPLLVRCLKRQKTDCFGKLRLTREFVPDSLKTLKASDLRQGEVLASYCPDLAVLTWRGDKIVSMISTFHRLQIGATDKYNRLKCKPHVAQDYNKAMGGVNRRDQFLAAQPIERARQKVWSKKLFYRLFNAAIFNCYVIYSTANPTISHRQFRTILAENLLVAHRQIDLTTEPRLIMTRNGSETSIKQKKPLAITRPSTRTESRPRVDHKHFPVRSGHSRSRCWMCSQQKVTSRTVWKCLECDTNLCIDGCFMAYHT